LNDFMAFAPTHTYAFRVNSAINQVKRTAAGFPNTTVMDFLKGEEMVVVEPGIKARSHGLSRGRVVTVYQNTTVSGNPTDDILVSFDTPQGKRVGNLTLDEVDWKYCRTGHSTQGMECDTGIVVLLPSQVTTRRWLYTAVSRCKQRCVLVCQKKDLIDCLKNDAERRTLLPAILDKAKAHWNALNGMPKGSLRSRK
jgi:ATP-dependent exoDNAse (exonuclease V) alpha subunit